MRQAEGIDMKRKSGRFLEMAATGAPLDSMAA